MPDWREIAALPGRRLFFAVPLAESARSRVAELMAELMGQPPRLRWVRPESLHLTLRFLGPTPDEALEGLGDALAAAASTSRPFGMRLGSAGAFPPRGRPRLLWVGIDHGAPELASLAAALEDQLDARGWPRDERPFRAHLTLARCDGIAGAERIIAAAVERAARLDAAWTADRAVLFESITGRGPARYEPLLTVPLGGSPGTASLPHPPAVR